MTILGKHTIAETTALGNAVDYQFKQVDKAFNAIGEDWKKANPDRYAKLVKDWSKAKSDWNHDWSRVQISLGVLRAATPGVSNDIIPSEDDWQKVNSNTAAGGRNGDDSLYMTRRNVEQITGKGIDFSGQPSQSTDDVDINNLKKADDALKKGEQAAKDAAKSNTALLIGLGAAGAIGLVIAAKVYL